MTSPDPNHAERPESMGPEYYWSGLHMYDLYPRKVGKRAAITAAEKAMGRIEKEHKLNHIKAADYLAERVVMFAIAVEKWEGEERKFCPYPATWFNQDRYDDDQSEWVRAPDKKKGKDRTGEYEEPKKSPRKL